MHSQLENMKQEQTIGEKKSQHEQKGSTTRNIVFVKSPRDTRTRC